jgi:plasmid stabilization system protein ParE
LASVVVAATAERDLRSLVETHSLPRSTEARFKAALDPLRRFPLLGSPLTGRWSGYRYILGPWRWMIIVYRHDPAIDRVEVLTVQDARSANAATGMGS